MNCLNCVLRKRENFGHACPKMLFMKRFNYVQFQKECLEDCELFKPANKELIKNLRR